MTAFAVTWFLSLSTFVAVADFATPPRAKLIFTTLGPVIDEEAIGNDYWQCGRPEIGIGVRWDQLIRGRGDRAARSDGPQIDVSASPSGSRIVGRK